MIHIILGTAHLKSTPGKCSPDKSLYEYKYSRELVQSIYSILKNMNYDVYIDIPENDLKITTSQELYKRVKFVNNLCNKFGKENCIYISIHVNGAGNGSQWMQGTGWECWTSLGKTKSDLLAEHLYKSAKTNLGNKKIRTDMSDGDSDKESNLYVLKNTNCAAVLTENFFQDNKDDVKFLLSDEGFHKIVRLHIEGILNYIKDNY